MYNRLLPWISFAVFSCAGQEASKENSGISTDISSREEKLENPKIDNTYKTIHIFVALCDNKYQGIVPVPSNIGNGQNPSTNLYWGSAYGVKTYFSKSKDWLLEKAVVSNSTKLERVVFKHRKERIYLVADAYDGKSIKECTQDFLKSACGQFMDTVNINNHTIGIGGYASLVSYIGHDGLMDFELDQEFNNRDRNKRDIIVLACYSKNYFSNHLKNANVNPLVWTTGLMAPEAYTIHDAIDAYLNNENSEQVRSRAALAYSKYQRCSLKAARNLLVTGW